MVLKASEVSTIMMSKPRHGDGIEQRAHAGQQRADDGDDDTGHDGFDGARSVETEDQFGFGDGRDQIALVHAAGLVVDVEHAAADHHRDEHGQGDGAGQQILHVFDVGIQLDNLQRGLLQNAGRHRGLVQSVGDVSDLVLQRGAHEVVAVIHHQRDAAADPAHRPGAKTAAE